VHPESEDVVVIRYRRTVLVPPLVCIGLGVFFASVIPDRLNADNTVRVLEGIFAVACLLLGVVLVRKALVGLRSDRPLVLDSEAISILIFGRRYRVPWSEITGCGIERRLYGEGSASVVVLTLTRPKSAFVTEGASDRSVSPEVVLPTSFDITKTELASLINRRLLDATHGVVLKSKP
jgi:hypothetical protein